MWFSKFLPTIPVVRADAEEEAEIVDPQETLRAKCRDGEHCKALAEKLQTCNDRVNSRTQTAETCTEELFDLLHAVEHCVSETLFSKLK